MQEIVLGWVDRKVGDRWVILLTEPATTTPKTEFTATVEDYPLLSVGDYVRLTLNEGNIVKIETDKKEKEKAEQEVKSLLSALRHKKKKGE